MTPVGTRYRIADRLGERGFYGWAMVAVAGFGIFASGPGQSHTFSVFLGPIGDELGLSQAEIAAAYGAASLAAGFLLPLVGRLIDRFGPRKGLIAISALLGLACLFFGAASGLIWLVLGFGLLRFLGQGSMQLGSGNLVAQWFSAKRGIAMSMMMLGWGMTVALHPPLALWLIETVGWREAWMVLGLMTWVLMLPALFFLVIDKPEDIGLRPDNAPAAAGEADTHLIGATLSEAVRHPSFYLIVAGQGGLAALQTALHYHQINVLTGQGISEGWAASAFTIVAATMMVSMPLIGRIFDRFRTRYVFAAALAAQSSALIGITFAESLPSMFAYAFVFGINNAFTMTMGGYVWARYFGRKHLGQIQGTGQLVLLVAASIGPLPISFALDAWGDATEVIWALAAYPVIVAVMAVLFLRTHPSVRGSEHLE